MSMETVNSSPSFQQQWLAREKENEKQYFAGHPDSLIPRFAAELSALDLHTETTTQLLGFMPRHKKTVLPIAVTYYQQAKQKTLPDEQNFFLQFFQFKGINEVVPLLIEDYKDAQTTDLTRWFISDCLYQIRNPDHMEMYLELVSDPQYGINRQMLVLLLGKLKSESAIPVLIALLEDSDVSMQSIIALGEYRQPEFRPYFEQFLTSREQGIRNAARASLKKIK